MSDKRMLELPGAALAFEPGAHARNRQSSDVTFWTRFVGDLIAPTGRIVACDPFECSDAPAFAREVPPGTYPMRIALAQFTCNNDERIVGAMVQLRDAAPVRWEPAEWARDATTASRETDQQEEGARGGVALADAYGVDSGFGAFMDEAAIEALLEHIDAEDDEDYLQRRWENLGPVGGAEWFDIPLDEGTGANILLCTSGWGDGIYPSYWGFAADDDLVCLLTDFGVVLASDFL